MLAIKKWIENTRQDTSLETLARFLQANTIVWGFDRFAYFCKRSSPKRIVGLDSTYSKGDSIELSISDTTAPNQPTLNAAEDERTPVFWKANDLRTKPTPLFCGPLGSALWGLTVPIHGQEDELSALTLFSESDNISLSRAADQLEAEVSFVAHYAHLVICAIAFRTPIVDNKNLTPRELECLHWTALGKTSWEVSNILGVTEATVNYHLRNVVFKLDASNKTHAVSNAIVGGILNLSPFPAERARS